MKKPFLLLSITCIVFVFTLNSCTKEQMTINLLYGTWQLDTQLDNAGVVVDLPTGTTKEFLRTFYRCDNKENTTCTGSTKTTTTENILGSTVTTIDAGGFTYSVFGKTQMMISGTYYEIQTIKGKDLVIAPVEHPLATSTYSKI